MTVWKPGMFKPFLASAALFVGALGMGWLLWKYWPSDDAAVGVVIAYIIASAATILASISGLGGMCLSFGAEFNGEGYLVERDNFFGGLIRIANTNQSYCELSFGTGVIILVCGALCTCLVLIVAALLYGAYLFPFRALSIVTGGIAGVLFVLGIIRGGAARNIAAIAALAALSAAGIYFFGNTLSHHSLSSVPHAVSGIMEFLLQNVAPIVLVLAAGIGVLILHQFVSKTKWYPSICPKAAKYK